MRFGFRQADEYGIIAPLKGWQASFMVRPLTSYEASLRGTFAFPDPLMRA
ncbi:MAG: hypothetical protein ACRDGH_16980 [Candidatus Limnocylindria bacterium]